ncbi:ABC transporter permease [Lentibacter sp. XHP0401]|uniref:ABC transporter permease n=1 Tax=Lentibacter sp. XHP0401 TaxID=2984334 RepID=UPI0021E7AED8|nr:ABC transporter permease [Lentibacter sp. XHP0401]MCV2894649.1 ABC transporter permease [Lentibacter sp. XHP0401]
MSLTNKIPAQAQAGNIRHFMSRVVDMPFVYPLFIILLIVVWVERPAMLGPVFFWTIMRQAAPLVLVAIGQSLCMRVQSIDLSSSGVIVAAVYVLTGGWIEASTPVLCLLAIFIGLISGAVNAWFIAIRRSSAVLVTLATAMILSGVVLILSGIRQPDRAPEDLVALMRMRSFGVPMIPLVTFAFACVFAVLLRFSVLNRVIGAIGTNPKAAWASGLPYVRTVFIVHIMSGAFAAFAAIVLVGSLGKGSVILGQDLALFSLAAVVLGGVSFGVGRGGVMGPVLAAAMLTLLFNFLTAYDVAGPARLIVVGVVIVVAAIIISFREK